MNPKNEDRVNAGRRDVLMGLGANVVVAMGAGMRDASAAISALASCHRDIRCRRTNAWRSAVRCSRITGSTPAYRSGEAVPAFAGDSPQQQSSRLRSRQNRGRISVPKVRYTE
jgi:hypothetical protein